MGGFFDSEQSHKTLKARDMLGLTAKSHPEMFKLRPAPAPKNPSKEAPPSKPWFMVTESDIFDKSKGDRFGKAIIVVQTTWFITQYFGRWRAHQPRTQLEVMTLGYAGLNLLIYALWWGKPLNIQEPIDVRRAIPGPVDVPRKTLWGLITRDFMSFSLGTDDDMESRTKKFVWYTLLLVIGVIFGGVHCLAWRFPFRAKREEFLWKLSAVYCTIGPLAIAVFEFPVVVILGCTCCLSKHTKGVFRRITFGLFKFGYIICRIILLWVTFSSLSVAEPGIYEETKWASIWWPHFG